MNEIVVILGIGAHLLACGTLGEGGKEAYHGLKKALLRVVSPGDVEKLEQNADSDSRLAVVAEELTKAGKADDPELLRLARALAIELQNSAATSQAPGVVLKNIEAINLRLERVTSTGAGVEIGKAKLSGDLHISDIQAGQPPGK